MLLLPSFAYFSWTSHRHRLFSPYFEMACIYVWLLLQRNDARIIVGTFYEAQARHVFCQVNNNKTILRKSELNSQKQSRRVIFENAFSLAAFFWKHCVEIYNFRVLNQNQSSYSVQSQQTTQWTNQNSKSMFDTWHVRHVRASHDCFSLPLNLIEQ